jgi:hypothetical protein
VLAQTSSRICVFMPSFFRLHVLTLNFLQNLVRVKTGKKLDRARLAQGTKVDMISASHMQAKGYRTESLARHIPSELALFLRKGRNGCDVATESQPPKDDDSQGNVQSPCPSLARPRIPKICSIQRDP